MTPGSKLLFQIGQVFEVDPFRLSTEPLADFLREHVEPDGYRRADKRIQTLLRRRGIKAV